MSTRAASAATALRAKQELIRLLTRKQSPSTSPSSAAATSFIDFDGSNKDNGKRKTAARDGGHHHNDHHHSMYSYNDLRSAYLERIQVLHPDKTKYQTLQDKEELLQQGQATVVGSITAVGEGDGTSSSKRNHHDAFVALQNAWKRYEVLVKKSLIDSNKGQDGSNNGFTEGSFTMFGVGCSFSDNETERALREEITNQACRGWFSAGHLEASFTKTNPGATTTTGDASIKLSDDDMFVEVSSNRNEEPEIKSCKTKPSIGNNSISRSCNSNSNGSLRTKRKSLIDDMLPRNYGK